MKKKNKSRSCVIHAFPFIMAILALSLTCAQHTAQIDATVVIGITSDFDSLNELNAADTDALQVIRNMLFMTLTRLDENLQFEPYLAKRWELTDEKTTVTFFLRDDIYWNDGQKTTAHDVLFTYNTMVNPDIAYSAASRFSLVERVEIVDESTVQFHLNHAYPEVLYDLQFPILPKHILGDMAADDVLTSEFNRRPVSNGPFMLQRWEANQAIYFEADKNFAPGAASIDRIIFSILPEETMMITNLLTEEIDIVPRISPDRLSEVTAAHALRADIYDSKNFSFVGWNCARPLLSREMRRAFSYALNKKEIINTLMQGYGRPMKGPLLPMSWAYDDNVKDITFNLDAAHAILQKEGWIDENGDGVRERNGRKLKFSLTFYTSRRHQDAAVLVQSQLKKIGADVVLAQLDPNLFFDQVIEKKDFDAVVMTLESDFTSDQTPLWHSSEIEHGFNFVSYNNPHIDELLETTRSARDKKTAQPLWTEIQQTIINDCPYTFLFSPQSIVACNKRIKNAQFDIRGFLANIRDWKVK